MNHKSLLKRNVHTNTHLQNHFNKHNDLNCSIVTLCDTHNLLELEQFILDEYSGIRNLFNINKQCERSREGRRHTEETREKISNSLRGNKCHSGVKASDELRLKLSIAHTGIPSKLKGRPRTLAEKETLKKSYANISTDKKRQVKDDTSNRMKLLWIEKREYILRMQKEKRKRGPSKKTFE